MGKKFLVFLLVLTFVFSCCKVVYGLTPPPQIAGTIFLPEGKVAPPGGIKLKVIAECPESTLTCESTISEGENSAPYRFTVFTMAGGLEIRCELITPVEGCYNVSYYTGISQKPFKSDAVKLKEMRSGSDYNITLVASKKVAGEITLPEVLPVQRDSSVTLNFISRSETRFMLDGSPSFVTYFSKDVNVVIKEGEKCGKFEVDLPVYHGAYYYNYTLTDYISGVSPNSNKFDSTNELLEQESIGLVLDKGNIVRGKVRLPEGEVAGEGGFPVNVSAIYYTKHNSMSGSVDRPNYIDREVIIPEGQNYTEYELTVYPQYFNYYMQYSVAKNSHVNKGFYSKAGTVTKLDNKECVFIVIGNVDGIDLNILNGVKFSGKIMCPGGESASEDLYGKLVLYNNYYSSEYKYVIKKGNGFATFEFTTPENLDDFVLSYQVDTSKYVRLAYYNENGTTTGYTNAQRLSIKNNSIDNIEFYISENRKVSGRICIPEDLVSIDKLQTYVVAALTRNADGSIYTITNALCEIAPTERSALFELFISEEYNEVVIGYSIATSSAKDFLLVTGGYLGEDGMVIDIENAKLITPGQPEATDIELVPIKGVRISGVITVDEENQYIKYNRIDQGYEILIEDGQNISYLYELNWLDKTFDSQQYCIEIPPYLIGEKYKIKFFSGVKKWFYLEEDGGITEDADKARVFTVDGVDIKNLDISFAQSSSILYGDVNSDGKVNSIDLAKFRGYLLGMYSQDEINFKNSDLNLDGQLNSIDFALLRKFLLQIIDKLPVIPLN